MGCIKMEEMRGASFAGSSPMFLGRELRERDDGLTAVVVFNFNFMPRTFTFTKALGTLERESATLGLAITGYQSSALVYYKFHKRS